MKATFIVVMLMVFQACTSEPASPAVVSKSAQVAPLPGKELRIRAANELTRRYANSKLKEWGVSVHATGNDCRVLFIQTPVVMERSMIEAMHYGAGTYSVHERSIDELYREQKFRGVAYRDGSGNVMTFGEITNDETEPLCR
jgi:hypothetical protein